MTGYILVNLIGGNVMKKFFKVILGGFLLFNFYGCAALIVGAAGGAGTAAWLSGKLTQEVSVPRDKVADTAKSVLKSMNMSVTSELRSDKVTKLRGLYVDGRRLRIDLIPISTDRTRIEIRVGAMGDKTASEQLLRKISDRLGIR